MLKITGFLLGTVTLPLLLSSCCGTAGCRHIFGLSSESSGDIILQEDFESGLNDWYAEGGRSVTIQDGRLLIDADPAEVDQEGRTGFMATVWHKLKLEGDVQIDFDVQVESSVTGTNNINFFLFYTLPDGSSPEITTTERQYARYQDYHPMTGYIFTFLNAPENREAARVRIRRCPGFRLLTETYAYHNRPGQIYHLTIIKKGTQLSFLVDGNPLLTATDPEPLNGGYFGFRTFRTKLWFDNLVIQRL